jgi:FAD/FMN-containing dehydrogenase/Fe-S oxidoreductase
MEPLGVVLPRTQEDLHAAVELAVRFGIPILPRGAGTSLAGQAIGHALILDCSRWLDNLVRISPEERIAIAEPGLILADLNRAAAPHGLMFGPDPASADRATIGGVVGNNATGAHSILYGMTADHLLAADVILADGSLATLDEVPLPVQEPRGAGPPASDSLISTLYEAAVRIREHYAETIRARFPRTWRNSAGYRLNYLLPWSASAPPRWAAGHNRILSPVDASHYPPFAAGRLNLAPLLAGSEGTLAVIRRATLNLVPKPAHTALAVLAYDSIAAACDDVPRLLERGPSAVELIPRMLVDLARGVSGFSNLLSWVIGAPAALLVVEFSGDDPEALALAASACGKTLRVATNLIDQTQIWQVRKAGLGILDSAPTAVRPVAFIEDCAIPLERLGGFVREVDLILAEHRTQAAFYAHASAGCLHVRPMLDLRSVEAVRSLRSIASAVLELSLRLGGVMSSEHGDGFARSEWLPREYGEDLHAVMRQLKQAADPKSILNPGKIIDPPSMDTHLRFGPSYQVRPWTTGLDLSHAGGLTMAIEQCNGQGVCRKDFGLMCPSYQATRDEMNSTRGRANLLRALIAAPGAAKNPDGELIGSTHAALDLCLGCKGCKAECPSGVDMAKLKTVFLAEYHKSRRRQLSDYLFGYFHLLAPVAAAAAPVTNLVAASRPLWRLLARSLGLALHRPFPRFSTQPALPIASQQTSRPEVIFLADAFSRFVETAVEAAAFRVLDRAGYEVQMLRALGAGAALLSKGFVEPARRHAQRVLGEISRLDPDGSKPVVGLEPPEIYCLKNDYADLLPSRRLEIDRLAGRVWLLDEFLFRSGAAEVVMRSGRELQSTQRVLFHPHCHQRAEPVNRDLQAAGVDATLGLLTLCGYEATVTDAGCCGMAGTFGYEADHYELSNRIGELRLFPQIRARGDWLIAATGAACRLHIQHGTGAASHHPMELVAKAWGLI